MDLRDLIGMSSEDIKRMEMEEHLKDMPKLEDIMLGHKEEKLRKLAEATGNDLNSNQLSMYSTSELKRELRRRKGEK